MAKTTYINLDRDIENWGWYKDGNTFRVFVHLIIKANYGKHIFRGQTIHRGEVVTSYESLASALALSISEVRTAIKHLKLTGEIAVKRYPKYQVISVLNYDYYQSKSQSNAQSNDNQIAGKSQSNRNTNRMRRNIEEKEIDMPAAKNDWRNQ